MSRVLEDSRTVFITLFIYSFDYLLTAFLLLIGLASAVMGLYSVVFRLIFFWTRCIFIMAWPGGLHISGSDNMESGRPYLIVTNHSSLFDIPAIMALQPNIAWLAKNHLFKIPVFGHLIRRLGCVPVERKNLIRTGREISFKAGGRIKNQSIGIFPEGTRTLDGNLLEFRRGFIRMFRNCRIDILPVTLNGFFSLKPKNRFVIHPGKKLEIIVHKPLTYMEFSDDTDENIMNTVRQRILMDYKI
ncbi:MAG: lysophospholipid acyltransferase family protein [Brevinematales bacterium]